MLIKLPSSEFLAIGPLVVNLPNSEFLAIAQILADGKQYFYV